MAVGSRLDRFLAWPPCRLVRRGYARWLKFNRMMWGVSIIALTRALIYIVGSSSSTPTTVVIPRGPDLLPVWVLTAFGVLWLAVAMLGFLGAVLRDGAEVAARRCLGAVFIGWAFIYASLAFYYPDEFSFFGQAALWYGCAVGVFGSKPDVRYVSLVVAQPEPEPVVKRKGRLRRFVLLDRRRNNWPVAVERRRAVG